MLSAANKVDFAGIGIAAMVRHTAGKGIKARHCRCPGRVTTVRDTAGLITVIVDADSK